MEVVRSHQDRAVVRAGKLWIKIDTHPDIAAREVAAMQLAPLPTATIVSFTSGTPSTLALTDVPGVPLSSDSPDRWWRLAGEALRQLHATPPPPPLGPPITASDILEWIDSEVDWCTTHTSIDRGQIAAAADSARTLATDGPEEQPAQFQHGDFQPAHVFVEDGRVAGVLDWANARIGDGAYDLAVLTLRNPSRLNAALDGYGDADVDRIRSWRSIRRLAEIHWGRTHDLDTSDVERLLVADDVASRRQ